MKGKGCALELKVGLSDWQMSAWTSCASVTVKGRRGTADDRLRVSL